MTHYDIRHVTRYSYAGAVSESVMELRMRPATEGAQRCLSFELDVEPRARVFAYRDPRANWVHHFDIPRRHAVLTITARAQVEVEAPPPLPPSLPVDAWAQIDAWEADATHWDYCQPSQFAVWSAPLMAFAGTMGGLDERLDDPLTTVRAVMHAVHRGFEYAPKSTSVDSPIDVALSARRGVCQDFSHIMIAVLRRLGLPSRYVSGYIAPAATGGQDDLATIATHAWVEVCLPEIGWAGFDPTHDVTTGSRHVRVAVGRDYADVPPTRGVFKGGPPSSLTVSVEVLPAGSASTLQAAETKPAAVEPAGNEDREQHEQQQQQ